MYFVLQAISVTAISPSGQFIAAGCRDGRIIVWDIEKQLCIISEKSPKGMAITGLAWHPKGKEIAFVNGAGEFGTMENFLNLSNSSIQVTQVKLHYSTLSYIDIYIYFLSFPFNN